MFYLVPNQKLLGYLHKCRQERVKALVDAAKDFLNKMINATRSSCNARSRNYEWECHNLRIGSILRSLNTSYVEDLADSPKPSVEPLQGPSAWQVYVDLRYIRNIRMHIGHSSCSNNTEWIECLQQVLRKKL